MAQAWAHLAVVAAPESAAVCRLRRPGLGPFGRMCRNEDRAKRRGHGAPSCPGILFGVAPLLWGFS